MSRPDVCTHCGRTDVRVYRRDLCRTCHRKLFEHDLPMPPDGRVRPVEVWFVAWVMTLPYPIQRALLAALQQHHRGPTDAA